MELLHSVGEWRDFRHQRILLIVCCMHFVSVKLLISTKIWLFEDEFTDVTFANVTTRYPQNIVKVNINIQQWPFVSIQNILAIKMDTVTDSEDQPSTSSDQGNNGNIHWFTATVDDLSMHP